MHLPQHVQQYRVKRKYTLLDESINQHHLLKFQHCYQLLAQTALFLCSGLSSGITGAIIPVDAGYHIMAV